MVSPDECLFCKIARKEIPSKIIHEDKDVLAFLDINPASEGHALVISKKHASSMFDADDETLAKMISVVKKIATLAKENLRADGINVLQNNGRHAGQIVDHIHIHMIPRYENDGIMLKFPRNVAAAEHLDATVKKLAAEARREPPKEERHAPAVEKKKSLEDLDWEMEM